MPTENESLVRLFARAAGERGRFLPDLLGGSLPLVIWVFLWIWLAFGVVGPLSRVPVEHGARVELHERA